MIPQGVPDPAPDWVKARIAQNLRRCRREAKLSQQELAEQAALDIHTIQNIEYKNYHVLAVTLARIRKALGVSWNRLLDGV